MVRSCPATIFHVGEAETGARDDDEDEDKRDEEDKQCELACTCVDEFEDEAQRGGTRMGEENGEDDDEEDNNDADDVAAPGHEVDVDAVVNKDEEGVASEFEEEADDNKEAAEDAVEASFERGSCAHRCAGLTYVSKPCGNMAASTQSAAFEPLPCVASKKRFAAGRATSRWSRSISRMTSLRRW
jgi:hypothetical protein